MAKRTPAQCENIRLGCAKRVARPIQLCSIEGCGRRLSRKGLCQMHHWRLRTHGSPHLHPGKRIGCSVPACDRPHHGAGLCNLHRIRLRRTGSLSAAVRAPLAPKRYKLTKRPGHPLAHRGTGRVPVHRLVLFEQIGWMCVPCFWCGKRLLWTTEKIVPDDAIIPDHLDHDRHNNDPSNLVPACPRCNSARSLWRKTPMASIYSAAGT